jgi:putative redox protein
MDIVAILKKCKQRLTSLKVLLDGERPERGNPRPYKKINVRYLIVGKQLDERQVVKAIDESMQKFCHVGATLSGPAKITHSFQIEEG